jgi:hypothetical protein
VLYVGNLQEDSAGQVPGNQLRSEGAGALGVLPLTTPANITTDATGPRRATITYPARPACSRRDRRSPATLSRPSTVRRAESAYG